MAAVNWNFEAAAWPIGDEATWNFETAAWPIGAVSYVELSGTCAATAALSAPLSRDRAVSGSIDAEATLDAHLHGSGAILLLSWTASTSDDLDHYNIYMSAANDPIAIEDGETDTTEDTEWHVTDVTDGVYTVLVRAVDGDGNEEGGITAMAQVVIDGGGIVETFPADPRTVAVDPSAGGKLTVSWAYDPSQEIGGPGAAYEGRIYWDAGSGTIDFSSPKATVAMGAPTRADWYDWTSATLTDDQEYLFVVRIGSAAHPDGVETQNLDEHAATPSSDTPTTPVLSAEAV